MRVDRPGPSFVHVTEALVSLEERSPAPVLLPGGGSDPVRHDWPDTPSSCLLGWQSPCEG